MFAVVYGGSGSGKSEFAESLAEAWEPGEKIYLAAMEADDEESRQRIARHRKRREGKNYRTRECPRHLERVRVRPSDTVLLECLSNLVAGEMFHPEGRGEETGEAVTGDVRHLAASCRNLIVVTNDVFGDGETVPESCREYQRVLGEINVRLAEEADRVWRVICGIPLRMR